jgi:hypothetical protein
MFASQGILEHLGRGLVGLGALAGAIAMAPTHPWVSASAVGVGLIALRGCPMCWTIGLIQTVLARIRGAPTDKFCAKGQCAAATR